MNKEIAQRVKYLLIGDEKEDSICCHSWRALSEVICDEYPDFVLEDGWETIEDARGNQMHGVDLVARAAYELNENLDSWYDKQSELLKS